MLRAPASARSLVRAGRVVSRVIVLAWGYLLLGAGLEMDQMEYGRRAR